MKALETALILRAAGVATIPVKPDKRPFFSWGKWRKELPSEEMCRKWFGNGANIAILAGSVQCLDIDTKHAPDGPGLWDRYQKRCGDFGLADLLDRVLIQRTVTGGIHLVFQCAARLGNLKLAETETRESLLETRGEGGYFLIAPSAGYTLIQGDWSRLPELSADDRDSLLAVARSFSETAPKEAQPPTLANDAAPGTDYDARADLPALLKAHGWAPAGGSTKYWTRPGKTQGVSASWDVIPGRFWVFSTSTAFQAQHVYRPWHVFAILECGGDFKEAARRLGKLGYGAPAKDRGITKPAAPPASPTEPAAAETVIEPLPPIYAWEQEEAADWPRPVQLVQGVLYRGAKGMIAGPSKGRKTFLLSDLAVSVAAGVPWLGFPTTVVPVLYVNLELQGFAFRDRRREIQTVKLSTLKKLPLFSWHLRGYGVTLFTIRERLLRFCLQEGIGLIIFDPTYKLNQHGEENAAESVGRLLNDFEQVGREADSSVVFGHHFAKGDASAKNSIDRASGSGVWARDPDAILMLSPHQEEGCMVVEMHLRNFPQQPAFVIRWEYPCWQRAPEADPAALKGAKASKGQVGRQPAITREQLAALMSIPGLEGHVKSKTDLANLAAKVFGVTPRTVWRRFQEQESESKS